MKQAMIFKMQETGQGVWEGHPVSIEMADCMIRQYRACGWKEEKTVSPNLFIFVKHEQSDIDNFLQKLSR